MGTASMGLNIPDNEIVTIIPHDIDNSADSAKKANDVRSKGHGEEQQLDGFVLDFLSYVRLILQIIFVTLVVVVKVTYNQVHLMFRRTEKRLKNESEKFEELDQHLSTEGIPDNGFQTQDIDSAAHDEKDSIIITKVERPGAKQKLPRGRSVMERKAQSEQQYGTTMSISSFKTASESIRRPTAAQNWYSTTSFLPQGESTGIFYNSTLEYQQPNPTKYEILTTKYYLPTPPVAVHKYSLVDELIDNYKDQSYSDFFQERRRKQKLIHEERKESVSILTPLSDDKLQEVYRYWKMPSSKVISNAFQIELRIRDLQTLCDRRWLNDNVIDFYFGLITSELPSVFGWTTHFYTTLKSKGYSGVARWAKRKKLDITKVDLILVPINIMDTHWALATIDNRTKMITYYDSLSNDGNLTGLKLLQVYMIEEGKKKNSCIDFGAYKLDANFEAPKQQNGSDCGVFTCTSASYLSRNKALTYSQKDMSLLRRRMAYEIITQKLLN